MSELIKKIFSVFLALVVLISTSGFTVYEHHCNCCQTTDYSLVEFVSGCDHESEMHQQHEANVCQSEGCWDASSHDEHQKHVCSHDVCCMFQLNYEKLSIDFDKSQTISVKYFPQIFNVIQFLKPQVLVEPEIQKLIHISQNAPPILSETDFVIFAHALKIPF
jgi:hypothetical protein